MTTSASRSPATSAKGNAGAILDQTTATLNAWIAVDLDALDHNVQALRGLVGPSVELIAVVKANAYGAGVAGIAPALEASGVERFAVVWLSEALELRRLGIRRPVDVLGHTFNEGALAAVENDITLTCDRLELAHAVSRAAVASGRRARLHLHIDTGMHRDGLDLADAITLATAIRALPGVELEGLGTHMANADEPDDAFSDAQHDVFRQVAGALNWVPYRHTANSATALRRQGMHYDGVRVGLALHGVQPENTPALGLRPILSLHARLARVFTIAPGEGVSYGLTWRADRPSRLGLVPVGYADGWRRSLGNAGEVLVRGRRCPIVGRVCMDQFVIDLTDVPGEIREGDEAVLLGAQDGGEITADEVARRAGTIPWDVFASLQVRLPRLFHRGGCVVTTG